MRARPALFALAMVSAVVIGATAVGLASCRPSVAPRLADAEQAMSEGRYADAVRELEAATKEEADPGLQAALDKARVLAASEENYRAGLDAIAQKRYAARAAGAGPILC